jgi:hypothetical protein
MSRRKFRFTTQEGIFSSCPYRHRVILPDIIIISIITIITTTTTIIIIITTTTTTTTTQVYRSSKFRPSGLETFILSSCSVYRRLFYDQYLLF